MRFTIPLPLTGQTTRTVKVLAALGSCLLHFGFLGWAAQAMIQVAPTTVAPLKVTLVQPPLPLPVGQGDSGQKITEPTPQTTPSPPPPPKKQRQAAPARLQSFKIAKSPPERKITRLMPPLPPPIVTSSSAPTIPVESPQPDTNQGDQAEAESGDTRTARLGADQQGGSGRAHSLDTGGHGGGGHGVNAQPDYSLNPKPPYPLFARRMGVQGLVLLRVLVRANGSVALVELANSSGSPLLDSSAIHTVRDRWRFIPAQQNGSPVDSWTEVPIRFVLTDS